MSIQGTLNNRKFENSQEMAGVSKVRKLLIQQLIPNMDHSYQLFSILGMSLGDRFNVRRN